MFSGLGSDLRRGGGEGGGGGGREGVEVSLLILIVDK